LFLIAFVEEAKRQAEEAAAEEVRRIAAEKAAFEKAKADLAAATARMSRMRMFVSCHVRDVEGTNYSQHYSGSNASGGSAHSRWPNKNISKRIFPDEGECVGTTPPLQIPSLAGPTPDFGHTFIFALDASAKDLDEGDPTITSAEKAKKRGTQVAGIHCLDFKCKHGNPILKSRYL
jgi:hypothetical protein